MNIIIVICIIVSSFNAARPNGGVAGRGPTPLHAAAMYGHKDRGSSTDGIGRLKTRNGNAKDGVDMEME